jgi:hypothetical protein
MESKTDRPEAGSMPGGSVGGLRKSPARDDTLPEVLYTELEVAEKVNEALCEVARVYLERNDRL